MYYRLCCFPIMMGVPVDLEKCFIVMKRDRLTKVQNCMTVILFFDINSKFKTMIGSYSSL